MLGLDPEKWTMQGILWGFFVFGALIAGAGLTWTASTAWFLCRAEKATGLVVEVVAVQSTRSPGEDPGTQQVTSYYPVVEFRDGSGGVQRAQSSRAARSDHWKRGDEAEVYYDPKNSGQAFIRDLWMLWFGPGVLLGGGVIWMLLVGCMLMFMKRFDAGFAQDKARLFNQMAAAARAQADRDPSRQ